MYLCYVDEAGCLGALPAASSPIQPVFVLAGIIVDQALVHSLTIDLLRLKRRFYPGLAPSGTVALDWILCELKGADLRRAIRGRSRNRRRHAVLVIDRIIRILEAHDARLVGRVWIKGIGEPFDGRAVYTSSMQAICSYFQSFLVAHEATGAVIADSRQKATNAIVAPSIFTQKFKAAGDQYANLLEMPTFGHSENHAGIQLADLLNSALLFPKAVASYCLGHVTNPTHVSPRYRELHDRFGPRLRALQHRYQAPSGRWRGDITVSDRIGKRSGKLLFD